MSWVGAPAGLSIAGQVAERLRLELRQLGIVADLHEGKGLALLSVWVDLVVWCDRGVEGWRYRWWTGRVSDQTGRRGQPRPEGDDAVRRAATASGADSVISVLRSGLDTLLAREWWGGQALSSGQWQRIAGARAIHRDAGLLVMDEPTSDLDARAEHRIFTGLRQLAQDRAIVLVTHNLANTVVADRIVVMADGRVTAEGPFSELISQPGLFRDLWLLQQDRATPAT